MSLIIYLLQFDQIYFNYIRMETVKHLQRNFNYYLNGLTTHIIYTALHLHLDLWHACVCVYVNYSV